LEWGGHKSSAEGASFEAPRGVGFGDFLIFWLKIEHFSVYSDKNSQFIKPIAGFKNCM